ncbi:endoribonuclease [Cryptococcus gattii Ru294]|uniref:Brt1, putative n=2 Tax=Cryptococcus gattii TaxID=37769 RepID=E6R8E9_CRYGW|nr:Brt1, putative [Cryptococcus gattii WM276]KIR52627.1 endoribonuclease [Cryptococcus gattii Ru294]KIR82512.1 endoribonuclease [Cryptococcus gattii EJB2]KIY33835.1 endoribonuclease [Cryptococcus gattii E566]KJE04191.1 endoribonuclease [Cryptococcus gattii NT-10]ADV23038.1 Brt1, putative [Cryptococcus gattii WM276]
MPAEYVLTNGAPPPLPGIYTQAVRAGNYVYTSGSVGMTKEGSMVEGTVQDRTRQVIQNLEAVLKGANMTLSNVVKANIYLSNLSKDFTAVNEVWKDIMPEPKPARTCIGVAELPAGGTDVEIEFVAYDG